MVVELSWICDATDGKHERVPQHAIDEAEAWAKAKIEEEEMGDSDEESDESDEE